MLKEAAKSRVVQELERIVGSEFVSANPADLYIYSQDMTQAEPSQPDVVVLPNTVEEVQAIIRLANKERLPVTPYIAGGNIGGLTIPLEGDISLDLKRMNRIIEVNETDMYAIIDPGVQFGHMKAHLEKHHPGLIYTYAFSPAYTSVTGNALLQGLDDLSFRYGSAAHWTGGLEVVLPTGELVRIGSCAVSNSWHDRDPLPDLAGLFVGWQGATGVVTKMAVSLWPKPKHAIKLDFLLMDLAGAYQLLHALSWTRAPNDLIGLSYAWVKLAALAEKDHVKVSFYSAAMASPEEPEFCVTAEISANTESELKAKVEVIEEVVKAELKGVKMTGPRTSPSGLGIAKLPRQSLGIMCSGGGVTWVGTYGPMSNWLEAAKKGCEIQDKHGFTRSCYTRVMKEGHFIAPDG